MPRAILSQDIYSCWSGLPGKLLKGPGWNQLKDPPAGQDSSATCVEVSALVTSTIEASDVGWHVAGRICARSHPQDWSAPRPPARLTNKRTTRLKVVSMSFSLCTVDNRALDLFARWAPSKELAEKPAATACECKQACLAAFSDGTAKGVGAAHRGTEVQGARGSGCTRATAERGLPPRAFTGSGYGATLIVVV